ncbi:hypothetical protein GLAREA_03418 [Glarea lozoyensis ATCC 20868]|uniref:Uncharacterized protein n=1 Tax=Glarea lozoyensis (strain ATCC 20868 / MF5171) TaxID=1116229 RepID=S3DEP9_GLAL2|nr:uncharacterized protein GLAREA_03418 [Glarea lozoyensis ATCC 20868]EPE30451.1 hypothetical protein GLAREA_03418 [Glarea lozoyensis ATCC 20868]
MAVPTMATKHSPQGPPDRAFALQKYLLLHSQQDALHKHISEISPPSPTTSRYSPSSRSSSTSSASSDPFGARSQPTLLTESPSTRPTLHHRRSSLPDLSTDATLEEIMKEQDRLKDVNLQIKTTLTELLNCEGVRGNKGYRMWIQTRLMDVEKELKVGRSRSCDERRVSFDLK